MAGTFTIQSNPQFLNARSGVYTAWHLRQFGAEMPDGAGVFGYEDFRVKQRGAGANLSVDVGNTAINQAWIRGTTRDGMGLYAASNIDFTAPTANTMLAQINTGLIFSANDPTNPRVDQVFLQILDQQHDGGGSNLLQIRVVDGAASGTVTLDNRTGVGAVPANSILLADVLMPGGGASQVLTANIRDRRPFPLFGSVPVVANAIDQVTFQPHPMLPTLQQACVAQASFDQFQAAALMYLPRRIVGATRIRWKYGQFTTANAQNYIIAIADASGRFIPNATTGIVAYTGAANSFQVRSETITATTFDTGWYYVFIGNSPATAGAIVNAYGALGSISAASQQPGPPVPNLYLRATGGSTTLPSTILALTDVSTLTAAATLPVVPVISLSVG